MTEAGLVGDPLLGNGRNIARRYTLYWPEELSDSELTQIVKLMNRIIERENTIGFVEPLSLDSGMELVSELSYAVKRRKKYLLLAKLNDLIVGLVILTPHSLPNCKHLAELSRGIIDPEHRRRGILQRALSAIVQKCELLKIARLTLDVRTKSPAYSLWLKVGFEPFGVLDDYVRIAGISHSGTYMSVLVEKLRSTFLSNSY